MRYALLLMFPILYIACEIPEKPSVLSVMAIVKDDEGKTLGNFEFEVSDNKCRGQILITRIRQYVPDYNQYNYMLGDLYLNHSSYREIKITENYVLVKATKSPLIYPIDVKGLVKIGAREVNLELCVRPDETMFVAARCGAELMKTPKEYSHDYLSFFIEQFDWLLTRDSLEEKIADLQERVKSSPKLSYAYNFSRCARSAGKTISLDGKDVNLGLIHYALQIVWIVLGDERLQQIAPDWRETSEIRRLVRSW